VIKEFTNHQTLSKTNLQPKTPKKAMQHPEIFDHLEQYLKLLGLKHQKKMYQLTDDALESCY